jgi:hypothetical protein
MNIKLLLCTVAMAFSVPAPSYAACKPVYPHVVFCPTPGDLAIGWQINQTIMLSNTYSPGSASEDSLYAMNCGVVTQPLPKAKITEERKWNTKSGPATIVHVDLGGKYAAQRDTYAPDGEYLGKKQFYFSSGWFLKRDISCDAETVEQRQ